MKPLKVAITGPESSGKSTLAKQLSQRFDAKLVAEYARTYLAENPGNPSLSDLEKICKGQLELERQAGKEATLIICDTDMTVLKIWAQYVFGEVPQSIAAAFQTQRYDLILLCRPDLKWEPDPLRTMPNEAERMHLFDTYVSCLEEIGRDFHIISGQGNVRFLEAEALIQAIL